MVKKKTKPARSSKKRGGAWQAEEVQVNTGLPPQVEGQLRCFCSISVNQITWMVPSTPDVTQVRLKWWGEPGDGSLFRPVDITRGNTAQVKTVARYPVRSGPKQFASYLGDMASLVLEVLSGAMLVPIGAAEVPNLGQLAPNRPINGYFPVISPTEEKIGELHVSAIIESLMASYDSTGSIPTTDLSMETYTSHATQESTYPKQSHPVPQEQPRKPVEDPFISPASHQNTETKLTNGYAEDLRQHLHYNPDQMERRYQPIESGSTVAITTNGDVIRTNINAGTGQANKENYAPNITASHNTGNNDLLSVLLDRGNKLREQMIISGLEDKVKPGSEAVDMEVGGQEVSAGLNDLIGSNISVRASDGSFLREILKAEKLQMGTAEPDLEDRAVDLVFGAAGITDDFQMLRYLDGSPNASVSGDDDILSDPGDPIHNESILNELFYKQNVSSDDLSDLSGNELPASVHRDLEDPMNMRPPSRASSVSSLNLAFPEPAPKKPKKIKTPKRKSRLKLTRKGSKKRRSSKSRSRGSASECSDSEAMSTVSTPRSETSRVSFDMVPSDIEEPPSNDRARYKRKTSTVDGMSVERLTLLGRVHVARVTIENLQLIGQDLDKSSKPKTKTKYGMKLPRPSPKSKKTSTYFIEYQFPVVATSRDKYSPNAMTTEVMRVVSRNVKNGVVGFSHRSVFPVMFDGTAVEKWWKSALVFKVFSRTAGQKTPSLIGSCGIPLKSILKSDSLHVDRAMDVRHSTRNTSLNGSKLGDEGLIGSLKVIIELASDSKEFPTALAKTKLAEMTGKAKMIPIPQSPTLPDLAPKPPVPPVVERITVEGPAQSAPRGLESKYKPSGHQTVHQPIQHSRVVADYHGDQSILQMPSVTQHETEVMTLHTLLLIPDGRSITMQGVPSLSAAKRHPVFSQPTCQAAPGMRARDLSVRNSYLVCRMFWCDEAVHSAVCWGTSEPQYKFQQVAPVLMSQSLLERLKNNFMIVEVWDKKSSSDSDKLVGIVKLTLHQFYMSFRDKRICSALLKSQYPVIAVENYLPIVDPFSGSQYGQINIMLAMGSAEQVAHLVRMKTDGAVASVPDRPNHYLERQDLLNQGDTIPAQIGTECVVEHIFEVVVEGIRCLSQFDNMTWGEADCFVQYHFPTQQQTAPPGAPVIRHAVPTMKAFRTATTLCIADPTFNDVTRHRVLIPQGTPVQRELLTACANTGGGTGGLPFEVWCRFYHPNVRDQCIAKSCLPLAKLCAMITMQKRGEPSVQTFTLPLVQVPGDKDGGEHEGKSAPMEAGLMDVTIHYKTQVIQNEASTAAAKVNLTGAQVCISVGVLKASGLKTAAEASAVLDTGMQYPAEVGVNSYVRVKLSFLGQEGERITRTIARSFSPEFSHFMDFPCPLLWTEADSDALSLAEILESAEATFEVWHQVPGLSSDLDRQLNALSTGGDISGRRIVEKLGDVMLGTTTLPLISILSHRTGYTGWFPVNIPVSSWSRDQSTTQEPVCEDGQVQKGLSRVGGGVELAIKFAHHEDRERVIHAARGVGWSPVELDIEQDGWESEDEDSNRYHHINITIDHVTLPLQNALIAGQNTLDKTAQCYVRYKFYDKAAVMTKIAPVAVNSAGYITSQPRNRHDLQIADSSMFKWYLREERLEMQVWISYGSRSDEQQRPKHRDKLIGSAYIPLETLCDERRKQHRISGMYPLFKPGAASMGGAYLRAHITAKPQFGRLAQNEGQEGVITIDGEDIDVDYDPDDSFHQLGPKVSRPASPEKAAKSAENEAEAMSTFTVLISIDRAMHLPRMSDKQTSEEYFPNTYVSYPTAECTIQSYTDVFHNSDNPLWDHAHETKLSTEVLSEENKHLVFKVWHKPDGAPKHPDKLTDRVLGFVCVDLTPLASGLQQVCGWYNVMDFNGQVKGQIKISVIPQESVITCSQGESPQISIHRPSSSFPAPPSWTSNGLLAHPTPDTDGPLSLLSDNSPHFQTHFDEVRRHHEMLSQQLHADVQQFLRQQEEIQQTTDVGVSHFAAGVTNTGAGPMATGTQYVTIPSRAVTDVTMAREPSMHWRPSFPEMPQEDSSRSYLFTSLRQNLDSMEDMTNKLKCRLVPPRPQMQIPSQIPEIQRLPGSDVPVSSQGQYPLTSTQSSLTYELPRSQRETPRDDLALTSSHGCDSSRTVADSGVLSIEHSNEKYYESAPDSQRSGSDRLDTFRLGSTPRDFVGLMEADSGINQSNNNSMPDEFALKMAQTLSPRESEEKKDVYSESGGFSFKNSPRDLSRTPRDLKTSPRVVASTTIPAGDVKDLTSDNENSASVNTTNGVTMVTGEPGSPEAAIQDEPKQMSIIQEFPEGDFSDSEDEGQNTYYHRYRDLLEDDDGERSDVESDDDGDVVVPRTINDVSGKFTPAGDNVMLSREVNQSVPYGGRSHPATSVLSQNFVQNESERNTLEKDYSVDQHNETEEQTRVNKPGQMSEHGEIVFDVKDSWLLDSDKENEEIDGMLQYRVSVDPAHIARQKHRRQDSDTGYSSRDGVVGTNSETDMSRLHEHEHWENNGDCDIYADKPKRHLLSNVELESTTGSWGLKGDSERPSRISSAGSRYTHRTLSMESNEADFSDKDKLDHNIPYPSSTMEKPPLSARSEEIEDFFNAESQHTKQRLNSLSESDTSTLAEANVDKDNNSGSDTRQPLVNGDMNGVEDSDSGTESSARGTTPRVLGQKMPNFFMPVQMMEESMRNLQIVTDQDQQREKAIAASEMMAKLTAQEKFGQVKSKGKLPTAQEAKRIAKIFSTKLT